MDVRTIAAGSREYRKHLQGAYIAYVNNAVQDAGALLFVLESVSVKYNLLLTVCSGMQQPRSVIL
jgi:hypothetical protein